MDITYNKVDQTQLPINPSRVSASEYNQIAGSLMYIINASGLTPDSQNNEQLLNALKGIVISFPYIVETYSNGTSWYRVWSDGWCEQGGRFYNNANVANTINFLKEFKDTNFSVFINHGVSGSYANTVSGRHADEPYNFTTTGFKADTYPAAGLNTIQWEAKGYIN